MWHPVCSTGPLLGHFAQEILLHEEERCRSDDLQALSTHVLHRVFCRVPGPVVEVDYVNGRYAYVIKRYLPKYF